MVIIVKGFFNLREIIGDSREIELSPENATLRGMLACLSRECGEAFSSVMFVPATGELRVENPILVNGRHYRNLSHGLDTPLREGDSVSIFPPVAGG